MPRLPSRNPGQPPPPPKYVVNEAKYGSGRLSREVTGSGGSQMSRSWIRYHLLQELTLEANDDIIIFGYDSIVTRVNTDGVVSMYQLGSNGEIFNKNWP